MATPTLTELVHTALNGAELRNSCLTEEDGSTLEQIFVVLWRRGEEWGTHRAVLRYELEEGALMWGHYFRSPQAIVEAYQDYVNRIAEAA